MSFDSFFRELESAQPISQQPHTLCKCRSQEKGELHIDTQGDYVFLYQCSRNKACFQIIDSTRIPQTTSQLIPTTRSVIADTKHENKLFMEKFFGFTPVTFDKSG